MLGSGLMRFFIPVLIVAAAFFHSGGFFSSFCGLMSSIGAAAVDSCGAWSGVAAIFTLGLMFVSCVALSYTSPNRLLSCVLSMNTRFGTPFTLNRLQHYCKPPTELLPLDSAITIHSPPPQHSSQPSEATTHQSYCSPQHYISSSL
ncbi:hypothetical protein L2E82_26842 [Cichorium intybus]|uniref:Uncharacterized protein n=1 Tax=Cichorium intybus TaxID=13427 RepID=A0ACB9CRG3_CICIN|nr:hypothetical protein L2E82_26842 [Cichorium intybus]